MAGTGHNANAQLRSLVERIERLEEEKKSIADDIRSVYLEAKSNGYDVKALRAVVKRRKQDKAKLAEHEAVVETYLHALGDLATTELGQAALARKREELAATAKRLMDEMPSTANAPFHAP